MRVGIPRALLFHCYKDLWLEFFKNLNIDVIVSPPTNKAIIKKGLNNTIDEGCYSSKIYIGHVEWLLDKCDMIFVPRIENTGLREEYCTRLFGIYDLVKNTFPQAKLLHGNVNYLYRKKEEHAFMDIGNQLGKTSDEIATAYKKAVEIFNLKKQESIEKQNQMLNGEGKKVLIISHSYNTFDATIGEPILKFFKDNNIKAAFADLIDTKEAMSIAREKYKRIYWKVSAEFLGSIEKYKDKVDGIVLVAAFPCMPDSIMNELFIRTINNKPILSLTIDELDATAGLMTRLESFCDILGGTK